MSAATVWLVTDGDYSDYRVMGVYSTRAKAGHAAKLYGVKPDRIEGFVLDAIPDAPPGKFRWQVHMDRDGNTAKAETVTVQERLDIDFEPGIGSGRWDCGVGRSGVGPCIAFNVWAATKEAAIKIANEQRTALIAERGWPNDWDSWTAWREARGLRT